MPEWKDHQPSSAKKLNPNNNNNNINTDASSKACSFESNNDHDIRQTYISFSTSSPVITTNNNQYDERKPLLFSGHADHITRQMFMGQSHHHHHHQAPISSNATLMSSACSEVTDQFFKHGDWDELRSVVEFGAAAAAASAGSPSFLL